MKSQVMFHLETAITHLKQAAMKAGRPEAGDIDDWLRQRADCLVNDFTDTEMESLICFALADLFKREVRRV